MFIYITFDSNGFVTDYKKVETDGYIKVFVLDSWINQFAQYPDKFRYMMQPIKNYSIQVTYQAFH